jgi:hypothetical protein
METSMTTMTMQQASVSDFWDRLDNDNYWYHLAARTASEYFSGESDKIYLQREYGKWWVKTDNELGASEYDTLEEAKAAGEGTVRDSYEMMEGRILENLGMTAEWTIKADNGRLTLTSQRDPSVTIEGSDVAPRWWLLSSDEVTMKSNKIADLTATLSPSSVPGL